MRLITANVLAPAAGTGTGIAGLLTGALPDWLAITLILATALPTLLLSIADGAVTQYIRIRSSHADPARAHQIDTRLPDPPAQAQPRTRSRRGGGKDGRRT